MSTKDISWVVKAAIASGWQPHHLHVPNVMKFWEPKPPGTLWATPGLLRDSFTFYLLLDSQWLSGMMKLTISYFSQSSPLPHIVKFPTLDVLMDYARIPLQLKYSCKCYSAWEIHCISQKGCPLLWSVTISQCVRKICGPHLWFTSICSQLMTGAESASDKCCISSVPQTMDNAKRNILAWYQTFLIFEVFFVSMNALWGGDGSPGEIIPKRFIFESAFGTHTRHLCGRLKFVQEDSD